jgi:arginase
VTAPNKPYRIIEAPSILGLRPSGVQTLPQRLLGQERLAERLQASIFAQLHTPTYSPNRDPETLTLNAGAIAQWSPHLADVFVKALDSGAFPVILGGDCSIILGPMLGLKRKGRFGLLFVDGHADFYQPEVNPNGEAASMDLAFVTGHGPELLTDIEGRGPLVRSTDAVVLGFRDGEEQIKYGSQPLPSDLLAIDLESVRRLGIHEAARKALNHLCRSDLEGFFIHLDADCLDDAIMPAVDYRLPGGLAPSELLTILQAAICTGRAVGIEVTIYNPHLDTDGSSGKVLADVISQGLGTSAPGAPTRI